MLKIKATASHEKAGFQSMGADFMAGISERTARQLCGMYPTPKPGYEVIVGFARDVKFPSFKNRLLVQNIGGSYFVCSSSAKISEWPEIFKVQII